MSANTHYLLPFMANGYINRLDHFTALECNPDTAKLTKEHLVQIFMNLEESESSLGEQYYRMCSADELIELLEERLDFSFDSVAVIHNSNAIRMDAMADAFGDVLAAGGDSTASIVWECYADRIKEMADVVEDFEGVDDE
jgi:hypothetical protein